MLSSTSIEGATEGPTGAVRAALMRLIMQRGPTGPTGPTGLVDKADPMTVDFIRGCSLENRALLTAGASSPACTACAVDLALASRWKKIHAPESDAAVLAHIPLEALPVLYIEGLLDSGRRVQVHGGRQVPSAAVRRRQHEARQARQARRARQEYSDRGVGGRVPS
jgi:hypothetical protein